MAIDRDKYKGKLSEEIVNTVVSGIKSHGQYVLNDRNSFFILEDSKEDMGLLRSIEHNFPKILDILKRYIEWSKKSGDNYFEYGG